MFDYKHIKVTGNKAVKQSKGFLSYSFTRSKKPLGIPCRSEK